MTRDELVAIRVLDMFSVKYSPYTLAALKDTDETLKKHPKVYKGFLITPVHNILWLYTDRHLMLNPKFKDSYYLGLKMEFHRYRGLAYDYRENLRRELTDLGIFKTTTTNATSTQNNANRK